MNDYWMFAAVGLTTGSAYAMTAIGVVTTYRGSGVLNFAHGGFGMVGAYAFYESYKDGAGLPMWLSIAIGLLAGASVGVITYLAVMRPLRDSVELARLVAGLGVLLSIQAIAVLRYDVNIVPVRRFIASGSTEIAGAEFRHDTLAIIAFCVVVALVMSWVFRRTRIGLASAALQQRPDAAAVLGISPLPAGVLVWAIGGFLAAAAGIFLLPITGLSPTVLTLLVFPAMASGLLARFTSYPVAILASLCIGVFEALLLSEGMSPVIVKSVPFVVIVVALVVGGTAIPGRAHVASRLPKVTSGRISPIRFALLLVLAAVSILVQPSGWSVGVVTTGIVALLGLSVVVATGFTGQLTLASFAIAGLSSLAVAWASREGASFLATGVVAIAVGIVSGALIGLPAIRVRGVDLAVATLGFSLVVTNGVLMHPALNGGVGGIQVEQASVFGVSLAPGLHPQRFALLVLGVVAIASLMTANLRRSRAGRRLVSVRANERGAAALGISAGGAKVAAFALSGVLAAAAGWLLTYRSYIVTFEQYGLGHSINALIFTVVGGVGLVAGAWFAGVAAVGGVMSFLLRDVTWIDSALPLLGGLFVLFVMLRHPDGEVDRLRGSFVRLGAMVRSRIRPFRTRRETPDPQVQGAPDDAELHVGLTRRRDEGADVLAVTGLTVRYGSVEAVRDVDLTLRAGRILAIIGPNGAGKTSLIDAITGFTRASAGDVVLLGKDVSRMSAVSRSRAGLSRTFQNLELFLDLTVRENLLAASDSRDLGAYVTGLVRGGSHALPPEVAECVRLLKLETYLDGRVEDLPQGIQRLVAIARALATRPEAICLDEPTAGLGDSEREAVAGAVRMLADRLGIAVMLVEHNLDVVHAICDEAIVLDFGSPLAVGRPADVLALESVRSAYLGIVAEVDADPSTSTVGSTS